MEIAVGIAVGVVFCLLGLLCVGLVAIGLPGAWIMLGLALVVELSDGVYRSGGELDTFGWWLLGACGALALGGEVLELIAGASGAKKGGSSRRGTIGALIGGVAGAFLGLGIPLPIVGSLVGAVVGTFVGAILGEISGREPLPVASAVKPATAAMVGRVLGTLAKVPIAAAVWLVLTIAVFLP